MYKSEFPQPLLEDTDFRPTGKAKEQPSFHVCLNGRDEITPGGVLIATQTEVISEPSDRVDLGANAWKQSDLHHIIRNGLNLPTAQAFVDCENKTDVINRTIRSLNGIVSAQSVRARQVESAQSSAPTPPTSVKAGEVTSGT